VEAIMSLMWKQQWAIHGSKNGLYMGAIYGSSNGPYIEAAIGHINLAVEMATL